MIGYSPYSKDLKAPGDRRRFVFYAKSRNLQYEIADTTKQYDIIYITSSANISSWISYKKKNKNTKLIFEMVDAYTLYDDLIWNLGRGIYRFLQGREKRLILYYNNIYKRIFEIADAVVCNTQLQKDYILKYNKNVHISLDYFDEDITFKKTDYTVNRPYTLVWEGLSYTVNNILVLKSVLEKFQNVHLKIITNPEIPGLWKLKRKTESLFKNCKFSYQIIPWELSTFAKEISQADLAIIPIEKNNKLQINKPENKLILFWKIGIPVLTTDTPAYKNVFEAINCDFTCDGEKDWIEKLGQFINGNINVEDHMKTVKRYLSTTHSQNNVLKNWDDIFKSLYDSSHLDIINK